jgi:Metal-dependent hydrolases of the beta-lactamase superfamily I
MELRVCVLASGSKGNCTYLETKNTKSLIDIGMSCLQIETKLKKRNIEPREIQNIFITHTHVDHIAGLRVFIKKYNPLVFITELMYEELKDILIKDRFYLIKKALFLEELHVDFIKTSHDTEDSLGYIFESETKSIVYITDTGYLREKYIPKLQNRELYIMESNHDTEMLLNGKRPYFLKQRVLGDKGHLCNKESASYTSNLIGEKTKQIVLAHISQDNNTEELALKAYKEVFDKKGIKFKNIKCAKQNEIMEFIEL